MPGAFAAARVQSVALNGVGQHAEARNADFHAVAGWQRPHPGRGSGQHQVARLKVIAAVI